MFFCLYTAPSGVPMFNGHDNAFCLCKLVENNRNMYACVHLRLNHLISNQLTSFLFSSLRFFADHSINVFLNSVSFMTLPQVSVHFLSQSLTSSCLVWACILWGCLCFFGNPLFLLVAMYGFSWKGHLHYYWLNTWLNLPWVANFKSNCHFVCALRFISIYRFKTNIIYFCYIKTYLCWALERRNNT